MSLIDFTEFMDKELRRRGQVVDVWWEEVNGQTTVTAARNAQWIIPPLPGINPIMPTTAPMSSSVPYTGDPRDRIAIILVMDVVPDHAVKTFSLVKNDSGKYVSVAYDSKYVVLSQNDSIDPRITNYVILYNGSDYHNTKAQEVRDQINQLVPGAHIMTIPIAG